ncbi:putative membrane-bound dehydrogenase-like protein [Dyadobacter jejuensis]|uniref:Putative membrane-bound dehydrogenase-like protein n=1 Tax=Dyadobacter jejuensis TaxID=1082580 RepID=A0A316ABZ3_9BACT|nr:PVC-type heme-binding CxxCH protein [Dyadobacter jejuensis]PWJ54788.1 putative membrane-bound dehydrogenase-like protein [Dyadobacter jejuensis]
MKKNIFLLVGLWLLVATMTFGQKKTHSTRTRIYTPAEEMAGFKVPPGFVVELVASEKDGIINPIDLTFDDAGRLWTQTASMYPLDPVTDIKWNELQKLMDDPEAQRRNPEFKRILDLYSGKTKGADKILVLSGLYANDKPMVKVWADGLTIPMSILPYKNGAYVAQGSELFFLDDPNADGLADERKPLLTGFGITDTHTMTHVLTRAPGGWINFSHGALNKGKVTSLVSDAQLSIDYSKIGRFSLDGRKMELLNAGLNNIWGYQLRGNGQWYGCEANDLGYSIVPMEAGAAYPGIGTDRLRSYQPFMPQLHRFRVGGTGISGLAFADDASGSFPAEWKDVALLANPITSTINAIRISRLSDGRVEATHLPDFLTSEDDWFRPVNMEFGPDGCLYIADWYNKIVSHNELPTTHPDRDKGHGRIWRIRHESQDRRAIPDLTLAASHALIDHLKSPSLWEKRAAWHQIADRPATETKALVPALAKLILDPSETEDTRIHALWALESLGTGDLALLDRLMKGTSDDLRREAMRALVHFEGSSSEKSSLLMTYAEDPNPMIRSQILRSAGELDRAALDRADPALLALLIGACKPELPGNEMGGSYERRLERYLARKALEKNSEALEAFVLQELPAHIPAVNMLWAIQALPQEAKEKAFQKYWPMAKLSSFDESTFVAVAGMLANTGVYDLAQGVISQEDNQSQYLQFAIQNQAQVQSEPLKMILAGPVQRLLKSNLEAERQLALEVMGRYQLKLPVEAIGSILAKDVSEKTLGLALKALEVDPAASRSILVGLIKNDKIGVDLKRQVIGNLLKSDAAEAQRLVLSWLPTLSDIEKKELVTDLSRSVEGGTMLKTLYGSKKLSSKSFDLSAAERILEAKKSDPKAQQLLKEVKAAEVADKQQFQRKLDHYMTLAAKKSGSPKEGKVLFQTCLLCHQVGSEGQKIAPALDGSASREMEALLTAILDPDAAVESNYAVYRISKKDGSTVEGYLVNKDERGATIAFMGGTTVFVPTASIAKQGFMAGRSFMVKGLMDHYSDQQVADLLSFINTLK